MDQPRCWCCVVGVVVVVTLMQGILSLCVLQGDVYKKHGLNVEDQKKKKKKKHCTFPPFFKGALSKLFGFYH